MVWDDIFSGVDWFDGHDHHGTGHGSGGFWKNAGKLLGGIGEFILDVPLELLYKDKKEDDTQKSGNRNNLNVFVGASIFLATAGAVYLYMRHKHKQAQAARRLASPVQPLSPLNERFDSTPEPQPAPAPLSLHTRLPAEGKFTARENAHAPPDGRNFAPAPSMGNFTDKSPAPAGAYQTSEASRKAQPQTTARGA